MKKFLSEQNLNQTFMMGLILLAFLLTFSKVKAQNSGAISLKSAKGVNAVSESDSLILVNLYNSTGGPDWTNNTNWLNGPLNTWYGIIMDVDSVTQINLKDNNLNGTIPPELGLLSKLQVLDLDTNKLSGIIPVELSQLSKLKSLILRKNSFTGEIPKELAQLSELEILELDSNRLSGSIPVEIGQLSNLTSLRLSGNQLSGAIPVELGQLTKLIKLYLNNNLFSGTIPKELGQLTKLQYLFLNQNSFTGSIPPELAQLTNLLLLYLDNNQLSGSIPVELGQLTKMLWFNLSQNQLTGTIPTELDQLVNLEYLNLAQNQISGSVPDILSQLTKLKWLNLGNNLLSGTIPNNVWLQPELSMLYLNGNQLTGSIPVELVQLSKLKWLNLSQNQLTGSIPVEFGQLDSLSLLFLNGNQLTGTIPAELGQISSLKWLNLNNNQLSGIIPVEIWNLKNLAQLFLGGNQLTDTIPVNLGQLSELQWISLDRNSITGSFPSEISQLNRLKYMNVELNQLDSLPELTLPDSLTEFYIAENKFTFEDLEYNMGIKSPTLIFDYVPQDSIGENISETKYRGDSFSYDLVTGGTQNSYQWYKNGKILPSQTSPKLEFPSLIRGNSGKYYCEVSNAAVTDLKLTSKTITLNVIDTTETCVKIKFIAGWNIFSSPVMPDSADMKTIFQPLIDNKSLIKIQDELGNSLENWGIFGGWQNNIGNISTTEGYRIKMSKPDSIEICGKTADFPFSIPLQAGWNIIGYPRLDTTNALNVVQQLIDRGTLKKVQDESGNSLENWGIFGGWQNNIGNFNTGEGYKIKMILKDTLNIYESYPKSIVVKTYQNNSSHFKTIYKGNGVDHMNINLVNLPVNSLKSGDELAVFDGTVCVGSVVILPTNLSTRIISVIASANDDEGISGFIEGNTFTLKLWNSEENKEITLEPQIIEGNAVFTKNETTLASIENYNVTGLADITGRDAAQINCYPNPFSDELTIEFRLTNNAFVTVEIINQLGQSINSITTNNWMEPGVHLMKWDGKNRSEQQVPEGMYYIKIVKDDEISIFKVIHRKH